MCVYCRRSLFPFLLGMKSTFDLITVPWSTFSPQSTCTFRDGRFIQMLVNFKQEPWKERSTESYTAQEERRILCLSRVQRRRGRKLIHIQGLFAFLSFYSLFLARRAPALLKAFFPIFSVCPAELFCFFFRHIC